MGGKPGGVSALKPLNVTFQVAKQMTGLGMTTLWALAKTERIQIVRVGRRTLINFASLERLLSVAAPQSGASQLAMPRRGRPPKMRGTSDGPALHSSTSEPDTTSNTAARDPVT
jgi:hypothetical protein